MKIASSSSGASSNDSDSEGIDADGLPSLYEAAKQKGALCAWCALGCKTQYIQDLVAKYGGSSED